MRRKHLYKYKALDCTYCYDREKWGSHGKCRYKYCPHIMENLSDMFADNRFCEAVENPENCVTNHRQTLEYVKTHRINQSDEQFPTNNHERCNYKNDCKTCNYGSTGFVCLGNDGTCLKDWLRDVRNGGDSHAGNE